MKLDNRLQLMEYLGAKQKNTVWSWCGVNADERKVYFSIWSDAKVPDREKTYYIQQPDWGIADGVLSPARRDHDDKISLVLDQGYEAYGYFIEARDRKASPREIESTKTSFIMRLELQRTEDGSVIGKLLARIDIR